MLALIENDVPPMKIVASRFSTSAWFTNSSGTYEGPADNHAGSMGVVRGCSGAVVSGEVLHYLSVCVMTTPTRRIAMAIERCLQVIFPLDPMVAFGGDMHSMDDDLTQMVWLCSGRSRFFQHKACSC